MRIFFTSPGVHAWAQASRTFVLARFKGFGLAFEAKGVVNGIGRYRQRASAVANEIFKPVLKPERQAP